MAKSIFLLGLLVASLTEGFFLPSLHTTQALRTAQTFRRRLSFYSQPHGTGAARTSKRRGYRSLDMDSGESDFVKTLAVVAVIGTTIGASAIPFLIQGSSSQDPQIVRVLDEDGNETERGAMTSMTRSEIQQKLSQIPVFFLRDPNGGVHLERGEGSFFMSPEDARAKLEGLRDNEGTKVAATTLDDVWFPLIMKKGPNKRAVSAQASISSDPSARYRMMPRASQLSQAMQTEGWSSVGDKNGVPVWAARNLAFEAPGSKYKVPLFTNLDDLMASWDRLKPETGSEFNQPNVQVSSIGAIVDLMEKGGGDIRKLEFFADMDAINKAKELF